MSKYARPMRILLVEDEAELADALATALRAEGLRPDVVGTLAAARERTQAESYDLLLLDRRLPDGDGLTLSGELPDVPALALTAASDDGEGPGQLTKPFALGELVARVHRLLSGAGRPLIEAGSLRIEPARRRVRRDGVIVPLTTRELDVLLGVEPGDAEVRVSLRRKLGVEELPA